MHLYAQNAVAAVTMIISSVSVNQMDMSGSSVATVPATFNPTATIFGQEGNLAVWVLIGLQASPASLLLSHRKPEGQITFPS